MEQRAHAVVYVQSLGGLLMMQAVQIGSAALIARIFPSVEAFGRFSLVQQVLGLGCLL